MAMPRRPFKANQENRLSLSLTRVNGRTLRGGKKTWRLAQPLALPDGLRLPHTRGAGGHPHGLQPQSAFPAWT